MPFTFSHPAIVLPLTLKKLRLSATGLIVGSLIPDFEYFIRMRDVSRYSHTLVGLFWFDVPVALLACFIYHQIARDPLFNNLPFFLKKRVFVYKKFQWIEYFKKNWIVVLLSIIVGASSHLLWDDFTHETKFFVQRQPDLSELMRVGNINLAGYRFLQLISSVVGGLIVIITILALKKRPCNDKSIDIKYWALLAFISGTVMIMRYVKGLYLHDYRVIVVSFISSILIALILTPMILHQPQQPSAGTPKPEA